MTKISLIFSNERLKREKQIEGLGFPKGGAAIGWVSSS